MIEHMNNYLQNTLAIGISKNDNDTLKLKKASITIVPLIMGPVGLLWSIIYFSLGQNLSALFPFLYSIMSLVSLWRFHINKDLSEIQRMQMSLVLIMPFLLMWSLGGFAAGSYVMIWSFFAPVVALIHDKSSKSIWWLYAFIALTVFSSLIDMWLIDNFHHTMPKEAVELFFFLNISVALAGIYFLIKYFINQNDANALEKFKTKNDALVSNTAELFNNLSYLQSYKNNIDKNLIVTKTDIDGKIIFANENFYKISGFTAEEVIGKTHSIVRHPDNKDSLFKQIWSTITGKKAWQGRIKNINKDGSTYWIDTTISPILDKDENIVEFIAIRHDITKLMKQQDELTKMLYTDQLTGLKNRNSLLNELKHDKKYSLILVNIDRFSQINDLYGSVFGDKVIQIFSKKMLENVALHLECKLYRLNGDEFVILSSETDKEIIIDNVNKFIQAINSSPLMIGNVEMLISITSGISFTDSGSLLPTANMAFKVAKREAKHMQVYDDSISLNNEYENNLKWINKIKTAITDDRIDVFYQPIIDNTDHINKKYEALIRLIDTDGKVITPFFFLDIAKKAKLYRELTKIVIKKSFATFKDNNFLLSVNITVDDILDKGIRNYIYANIKDTEIASRVTFEIVESEDIKDFQEIEKFINTVKSYGCKIAIDDFGTGYSNFEHLMKLQADYIKIDGSIIKEILHDKKSEIITSVIVAFAKEMNIQTIGEFVENKEINDKLISLGINKSQGYYFGKPEATLN